MGLSQDWKQLPGETKMFIIGGGATALFILLIAIRGKGSTTQQQQATTQATLDPSGWIDAQTQQTQYVQQMIDSINSTVTQNQQANTQAIDQNNKSMQQLITQNQQATQQQIQNLINNMPKAVQPAPAPTPPPSPSPAAPAASGGSYTVKPGDVLWNIAKFNVLHGAVSPVSDTQVANEVNLLAAANHIPNPNLIHPGDQINW